MDKTVTTWLIVFIVLQVIAGVVAIMPRWRVASWAPGFIVAILFVAAIVVMAAQLH